MKIMSRIFAAAVTAALALGTPAALPASAEETPAYQMGDVNMDGRVDIFDALRMLQDYSYTMMGSDGILTEEQYALADLDGYTRVHTFYNDKGDPHEVRMRVTVQEAQAVLVYYTYTELFGMDCSLEEMVENRLLPLIETEPDLNATLYGEHVEYIKS